MSRPDPVAGLVQRHRRRRFRSVSGQRPGGAEAGPRIAAGPRAAAGLQAALGPPHAGAAAPGPGAALLVASAEAAFRELSDCVEQTLTRPARPSVLTAAAESLTPGEVVSNAAVLLFGGIETTEGMICNAVWFLLRDAAALRAVLADRQLVGNVVEESLRLEPAAAVVDRYACAAISLGEASIRQGDLVTVSLAGANRDPAVFPDPDRFDPHRENARRNWAFATGPHFCIGAELARTEATAAVAALLDQLPGLHLDPDRPAAPGAWCSASRRRCTSAGPPDRRSHTAAKNGSATPRNSAVLSIIVQCPQPPIRCSLQSGSRSIMTPEEDRHGTTRSSRPCTSSTG